MNCVYATFVKPKWGIVVSGQRFDLRNPWAINLTNDNQFNLIRYFTIDLVQFQCVLSRE
jgi:hypothetical protein